MLSIIIVIIIMHVSVDLLPNDVVVVYWYIIIIGK